MRIPDGATYADALDRCCSHRSPLRRDGECQDCLDEANNYIDPAERGEVLCRWCDEPMGRADEGADPDYPCAVCDEGDDPC